MSIAICRVDKCSSSHDIAGIQIHDRRERQHSNSNPDIDFNRSKDNYSLCNRADGLSFNAAIDEIIAAEYTNNRKIRKDAVRMVQVLFTSDTEFFANKTTSEQQAFFESCYQWAAEKWGESRIISANVHMDEKTPHMHLNFVPLAEDIDKKTGEVITTLNVHKAVGSGSQALQKLQDDFYKTVGKRYGLERGSRADLENGERPRKHQRVAEYKASTNYYQQQKNALESDVQALQERLNDLSDILHTEPQNAVESVPVPSMAKLAVGKDNKDKVLVSPSDLEQLQELAKAVAVTAAANNKRSEELEQKAAEQEKMQSELTERERIVSRKEKNIAELRSSAERMLSKADEKRVFYETSDPMVQRLQQQIQVLRSDNQQIHGELRQEKRSRDTLSEKYTSLEQQLSEQQRKIQPIQQQNGELSERVRVLEEELQQKATQLQELEEKHKIIDGLYDTACECGEYVCDKVGLDFDKILDMRIKGYRLSYIVDEGRGMSR